MSVLMVAHSPAHPISGAFNFVSLLTVLFYLPETSRRVHEHQQGKSKQSLREGLKSFKDWLMTKLIFTHSIGSFCNGGLLVAMVLFYSLSVEVSQALPFCPSALTIDDNVDSHCNTAPRPGLQPAAQRPGLCTLLHQRLLLSGALMLCARPSATARSNTVIAIRC
jgi:hypothetical protein